MVGHTQIPRECLTCSLSNIQMLNYKLHIVQWMVEILKWLLPTQHTGAFSLSIAQDLHSRLLRYIPWLPAS